MNRRYDRYLTTKYAPLYQDRSAPMNRTAMCWGFSVGDGWFDIINTLSRRLCSKWVEARAEYQMTSDRLGQLLYDGEPSKHNYLVTQEHVDQARAAMEAEAKQVPVVSQVKEKFGTLRFYTHGATDEQYAYINFAECMSVCTCEVCGARGRRRGYSWVTTRCQEHADA